MIRTSNACCATNPSRPGRDYSPGGIIVDDPDPRLGTLGLSGAVAWPGAHCGAAAFRRDAAMPQPYRARACGRNGAQSSQSFYRVCFYRPRLREQASVNAHHQGTDLRRRHRRPEIMDTPDLPAARLAQTLKGLRLVNTVTQSSRLMWPDLLATARRHPGKTVRVLDVACGGGDVLGRSRAGRQRLRSMSSSRVAMRAKRRFRMRARSLHTLAFPSVSSRSRSRATLCRRVTT